MLQDALISVGLLYLVLGLATYYDYRWPVQIFGHYLPRSFSALAWLGRGPIIMLGIGIVFAFMGVVLLLPIFLFVFGFKWLAVICLIVYGYLARDNSLVNINGLWIKFDFPFNIPVGILSFWIVGAAYLLLAAVLLLPLLPFFV